MMTLNGFSFQMSGILEFCDNTNTLGRYLIVAHKRYRPQDLPVNDCRNAMSECAKDTPAEKYKAYQSVCDRLKPVLQHMFTESFFSPVDWFEKRMFYINRCEIESLKAARVLNKRLYILIPVWPPRQWWAI